MEQPLHRCPGEQIGDHTNTNPRPVGSVEALDVSRAHGFLQTSCFRKPFGPRHQRRVWMGSVPGLAVAAQAGQIAPAERRRFFFVGFQPVSGGEWWCQERCQSMIMATWLDLSPKSVLRLLVILLGGGGWYYGRV